MLVFAIVPCEQVNALEHKNIVQIAAGQFHSLALDLNRTKLYAFGRGNYGQLGIKNLDGDECITTPTLVHFPGLQYRPKIEKIAAGESHSMALTDENVLYTWGFGEEGATGHKGNRDRTTPRILDLNLDEGQANLTAGKSVVEVHEISGGGQHSVILVKRYQGTTS